MIRKIIIMLFVATFFMAHASAETVQVASTSELYNAIRNSGTITLSKDIKVGDNRTQDLTVKSELNVVLDLNGHTLDLNGIAINLSENATLTIQNGTLTTKASTLLTINTDAKLTLIDTDITTNNTTIINNIGGQLTIQSGTYQNTKGTIIQNSGNAETAILNGSFKASTIINPISPNATLTISDGFFDGKIIHKNPNTANITGGLYTRNDIQGLNPHYELVSKDSYYTPCKKTYTLTVNSEVPALFTLKDQNGNPANTFPYLNTAVLTLFEIPAGYEFLGFYINDTLLSPDTTVSIQLTDNTVITAHFNKVSENSYTLEIQGGLINASHTTLTAPQNTKLTITANNPDTFLYWKDENGNKVSTQNPYTLTLTSNLKLIAATSDNTIIHKVKITSPFAFSDQLVKYFEKTGEVNLSDLPVVPSALGYSYASYQINNDEYQDDTLLTYINSKTDNQLITVLVSYIQNGNYDITI